MFSLDSWFGNMNQPIDIYCERTSAAWDAEPLNAISNIFFFFAALAAWRLQKTHPNLALRTPIAALCIVTAVVGAGSLTFHTIATRWAEWADVIPILVFMVVYCWLILTVFFNWPLWLKAIATLTFFLPPPSFSKRTRSSLFCGAAQCICQRLFLMAAGAGVWRSDASAGKALLGAAGLFILSFTARTIDQPLCKHLPIGTHYFWHFFNATVLFLLIRTLILHAPCSQKAAPVSALNRARSFEPGHFNRRLLDRRKTSAAPEVREGSMPHARRQFSLGIQRCAGLGAAVLLLCACANSAVLAQSFDCAKASKPVERLICADPALAALDGALGAEVKKALAAAPADRQALLADARRWLAERDKRCPLPAVALTAADRSSAASCLTAAYRERIAALQSKPASGTSPRTSAKTALCQQLANDYKARRKEADDSSPLQVLSSGPNPPVALAQPVMELKPGETAQAQAAEWAKAQPQPFAFSARVLKDFDEMGEVQRIDRLPGANLYAASSVQGTALCYTSSFFEVRNGRAEPATGPGSWDNRDGGGCGGAMHTFGTIGNTKVAFEESHGYAPSLTSSVTISPWEQGHFGAECTVTFTFAPHFEPHVPDSSAAEESCSGTDCEGLRQAALSLAQRVQADFAGVEKAEAAALQLRSARTTRL